MPVNITVTDKLGIGFGLITAPEMTQEEAETEGLEMARYRRKIDWRNPAVCFDERTLADGEESLPLGAHLAGGAETPMVAAKSVNYHLQGKELVDWLESQGFTLGGHDADTNKAKNYENGTGCGACDGCEGNCDLLDQHLSEVEPIMQAMMGPDFNKQVYYSTKLSPVTGNIRECVREENVETLKDDGEGVHGHTEFILVLEYEEDVSFDRDAYFAETGKKAFPIQMWYIKKLANTMATGVEAEAQATRLYNDMVAFQLATYMGLCDGNHRAVIFQPHSTIENEVEHHEAETVGA